jgi:hypothetical protein
LLSYGELVPSSVLEQLLLLHNYNNNSIHNNNSEKYANDDDAMAIVVQQQQQTLRQTNKSKINNERFLNQAMTDCGSFTIRFWWMSFTKRSYCTSRQPIHMLEKTWSNCTVAVGAEVSQILQALKKELTSSATSTVNIINNNININDAVIWCCDVVVIPVIKEICQVG